MRGFSLIEIMMTVAIMSTIAAFGIMGVSTMQSSSDGVKLTRDVAVLNKALRQYELFGGSLAGLVDAQLVIDKLKTKLTGDNRKEMAGLRGTMVDARLRIDLQTSLEAATTQPRARYDSTSRQFVVIQSGAAAIRRFVLDSTLASKDYGTETRATTLKLAKQDKWVWDYREGTPGRANPNLPTPPGAPPAEPTPAGVTMASLSPPSYNIASGTYPLRDFPLTVTMIDTNPPNVSTLLYSINGGPFQSYQTPVAFDPSVVVSTFASPLDPDKYQDSGNTLRDYRATPEVPDLRLEFSNLNLSYADLGGPMLPSSAPGPGSEGKITLGNRAAIPDVYENNTVFQPLWTYDGSNPLTSSTAVLAPPFSGGYLGNNLPVTMASWPTGAATLRVQAAIKTKRPEIVTNSAVRSATLTRRAVKLAPPNITFDERDVTLALDTASGNYPVGTRIFYTINGSDPGENNGEPVSGTLYTGPFTLAGDYQQTVRITTRAYPPVDFKPWFITSDKNDKDYKLPAAVDVYIGGEFAQSGGSGVPMRNIAKLNGKGAVDPRFNTGTGASAGSLVGVVRQLGSGVIAGGDFDSVNGIARPGIVRLTPSGAVDPSFNAGLVGGK